MRSNKTNVRLLAAMAAVLLGAWAGAAAAQVKPPLANPPVANPPAQAKPGLRVAADVPVPTRPWQRTGRRRRQQF